MNTRRIDTMSKEQIVAEIMRIAAYCDETYRLNGEAAGKSSKTAIGSRQQGEAIGRRAMCACIADDIAETFGISTTNNECEVTK